MAEAASMSRVSLPPDILPNETALRIFEISVEALIMDSGKQSSNRIEVNLPRTVPFHRDKGMRPMLIVIIILMCTFTGAASDMPVLGTVIAHGGGVLTRDVVDTFRMLCGEPAKLVVIPTANYRASNKDFENILIEHWKNLKFDEVSVLHTESREEANTESFTAPIESAGCVWLGGGFQSRLEDAYVGTAVEDALHALLARGGVIAGSSAGAAIMSEIIITGGNPEPLEGRGLALIPKDIILDQHFVAQRRESRLLKMLERHPGRIGFGIDESSALVFQGDKYFMLGKSVVMRCENQRCIQLEP